MKSIKDYPTKSILSRLSPRLLIIIAIALILLFPYKTTIVPEWKTRAVNKQGEPIPHARFRQFWDNDSYGIHGIEFLEGSDDGYIILPERSFYAPLIYRIPRSALAHLLLLAHGSVGNGASLNAFTDKCSSEYLNYKQIKSLPDVIVMRCLDDQ